SESVMSVHPGDPHRQPFPTRRSSDLTLAPGAHDIVAHRRLYLDEDSWMAVYSDSWDDAGRLWKFGQATMYAMPDVPATIIGSQRSEEHTSELQSLRHLVCRLLPEKKK